MNNKYVDKLIYSEGKTGIDQCYEDLANAIIIQAVQDYTSSSSKLLKQNISYIDSCRHKARIDEVVEFIYSEWFSMLTNVPADIIISGIEDPSKVRGKIQHTKAGRKVVKNESETKSEAVPEPGKKPGRKNKNQSRPDQITARAGRKSDCNFK